MGHKTLEGLLVGDCLELLPKMDTESVDAVVTDPPYEIGLNGQSWDRSGVAFDPTLWAECLRVLKPGGHLVAFGATRRYHRLASAVEDAGFEVRDSVHWTYSQSMPYSRNGVWGGSRLKPSHEPIVVARKPLVGTLAANFAAHGVGGFDIEGCRNGVRWPSNTLLSHSPECRRVGVRSVRSSGAAPARSSGQRAGAPRRAGFKPMSSPARRPVGAGGVDVVPAFECVDGCPVAALDAATPDASRFFTLAEWGDLDSPVLYVSKPSAVERRRGVPAGVVEHDSVKPVALMRHLVRLVTPADGIVLDPFLGSGSTAVAAELEGRRWVGCELTEAYVPLVRGRVADAVARSAELVAA